MAPTGSAISKKRSGPAEEGEFPEKSEPGERTDPVAEPKRRPPVPGACGCGGPAVPAARAGGHPAGGSRRRGVRSPRRWRLGLRSRCRIRVRVPGRPGLGSGVGPAPPTIGLAARVCARGWLRRGWNSWRQVWPGLTGSRAPPFGTRGGLGAVAAGAPCLAGVSYGCSCGSLARIQARSVSQCARNSAARPGSRMKFIVFACFGAERL